MFPPAQVPGRYRIELVCLGNICRSPMADVVLSARLVAAGLDDRVEVSSSGTGDWHVGDPMDRRAAATLTTAGYDATRHRAQQWAGDDAPEVRDLVLVMDAQNLADVGGFETGARAPSSTAEPSRVRLFRDFDPVEPGSDVPDPYYGGDSGFEEVLAMVERTASVIVDRLDEQRPWGERTS